MNGIVLTIGVNVYNVPKRFLIACLESVITQKGDDVEIIIVDDGSTDQSGKICDEYAAKDKRVCVIHQQNVGLGLARNVIIDNAQGKWITFVDGDDTLTPNAVEILRKYFNVQQQVILFAEKGNCKYVDLSSLSPIERTDIDLYLNKPAYSMPPYELTSAWAKMFNIAFIREYSLYYTGVRQAEDIIHTVDYIQHLRSVLLIPQIIYEHKYNPDSLTFGYTPNNIKPINAFISLLQERLSNSTRFEAHLNERYLYWMETEKMVQILYTTLYHPKCIWGQKHRLAYLAQFLQLGWVKSGIEHYNEVEHCNSLKHFCNYGKMGDVASIDAYYIKQRRRRQYLILCQTLRKVTIFSVIMDMLKAIKCKFQKN